MWRSWKNAQDWMDWQARVHFLDCRGVDGRMPRMGWIAGKARLQEMLEDGIGSGRFPTPPVSMFGSWPSPELENRLQNQTSE